MFTKKHYEAVAQILKDAELKHPEAREAINEAVDSFCSLFSADNPRFDAGRFIHASIATNRPAMLIANHLRTS